MPKEEHEDLSDYSRKKVFSHYGFAILSLHFYFVLGSLISLPILVAEKRHESIIRS